MGCGSSTVSSEEKAPSVLLLGVGGVGKSTVFKQIRMEYGTPWTDEMRRRVIEVIMDRYVDAASTILSVMVEDGVDVSEEIMEVGDALQELKNRKTMSMDQGNEEALGWSQELIDELKPLISQIWVLDEAKTACDRAMFDSDKMDNRLDGNDSYFFDNIDRLCAPGALPNDTDLIELRRSTTGVHSVPLTYEGAPANLTDVGGQVHERAHWMDLAQSAATIMYIISLSDYDQRVAVAGGESMNKLKDDSIAMLCSIASMDELKELPIVVVFNKVDTFKEKIENRSIHLREHYDGHYPGADNDWKEASDYIIDTCMKRVSKATVKGNKGERAYRTYVTCAKDKDMVIKVFKLMMQSVQQTALTSMIHAND